MVIVKSAKVRGVSSFNQCCHFEQMVFLCSLRENCKWIKDKVCYALMKELAADFCQVWNFPNCLDGKHIKTNLPPDLGSMYFNYKQFFSIVVTALVDAQHKFLFVDVGSCGRFAKGRIFNSGGMSSTLEVVDHTRPTTFNNVMYGC